MRTMNGAGRPEFRQGRGLLGCLILCALVIGALMLFAAIIVLLVVAVRAAFTVPL